LSRQRPPLSRLRRNESPMKWLRFAPWVMYIITGPIRGNRLTGVTASATLAQDWGKTQSGVSLWGKLARKRGYLYLRAWQEVGNPNNPYPFFTRPMDVYLGRFPRWKAEKKK